MTIRIKVIIPNSGMDRPTLNQREQMLSKALSSDVHLSVDCIERGPRSIESNTDEALASAEVLKACIDAQDQGFDAVVVYCFSDLAVEAARENMRIPVVGPGEVAMSAAAMISERFSVVTTTEENVRRTRRRLMKNAIARERMAAVRALDIPVAQLREDPEATQKYLERLCAAAVQEDGIDTIVLGCLGMAQYGDRLEKEFDIKVIDPAFLAVAFAELAVRTELVHSTRAYPVYGKRSGDGPSGIF